MTIPSELIDIIITELAQEGDLDSVRACSLVGTQLLHCCRKHLFSSIKLVEREETPRITAKLSDLLDGNPALATYVRNLELTLAMEYPTVGRLSFLQPLTNVEVFRFGFQDFSGENANQMEWSSLPDAFKLSLEAFIERNRIREQHFFGLAQIPRSIFHLFKLLQKVLFMEVTLGTNDINEEKALVPLRSLEIRSSLQFAQTAPLITVFDLANLGVLSIYTPVDDRDLGVIRRLLPECGSLQDLIIRIDGFGRHPPVLEDVGRAMPLKTLRRLQIGVLGHASVVQMPPYGLFEDELSAMSGSNVLENLRLDITSIFTSRLDYTPALWDQLDKVLSLKGGFPSLKQVEIHVRVDHFGMEDDEIVKEIKQSLEYLSNNNFQWLKKNTEFKFEYTFNFI